MRLLRRAVAIGGLLAAAHVTSAAAQSVAPRTEPAPTTAADSTVIWDRVLVHLWSTLASQLRSASLDSTPVAWKMSFPATGALPFARVEAHLRLALRAREATPADSVRWTLVIGPMTIVNDTARVTIMTDRALRCTGSDRTAGFGNVHEMIVPYFRRPDRPGGWGVARSENVLHGDRASCPRRSR